MTDRTSIRRTESRGGGYLAAGSGALGGALLGGGAFALPPMVLSRGCSDWDCLGWAVLAMAAGALGAVLGMGLGCYTALRALGYPEAGKTALVAVGLALGSVVWAVLVAGAFPVPFGGVVVLPAGLLVLGAAPLARHIFRSGRPRASDDQGEIR